MAEIQSRVLARAVATATRDALARRESIALLHGSEPAEVMKSKRAVGMDAGLLAVSVEVGKIRQLQDGKWYVHCKHCAQETTLQARNEEEAYGMLNERKWRLSMPRKKYEKRNWSCPSCAELWPKDTTPTATDAAGSAGQLAAHAAATSSDALYIEVEQLKAEVDRTYADAKQTMKARLGPTIVVGLTITEDEAKEMHAIAEETGRCGQSLVDLSVDIGGHCNPWSPTSIADSMEKDGNRLVTLASRLLQLWEPLRQVAATALAATALGQLIGAAGCCQSPAPPAQLITSWESIRLRVHIECHGITVR